MSKPLNLPADLIAQWAAQHAAANAKLEGRELPQDYVRSEMAQRFLDGRRPHAHKPLVIEMETLRD